MPIYEYRCQNGHDFEVVQSMTDDPVTECDVCGEPVQRVFSPVAVHYKGSGFYTTDYARKGKDSGAKAGDSKSESSSSGDSKKSESKSSSSSEKSKSASKD